MQLLVRWFVCIALIALVAACGGAKQEAKEPEPEATDSASVEESSEETESAGAEEATEGEEEAEDEPAESGSARERSPKQVLIGGEDVLFVFSFNASEAYQKAEEACTEKAKDDPKKKAECLSKASKQFDVDGFHFKQDEEGNWWWLTLRRKGSSLITLHKIQIEFGKETDDSITLKTVGKDKGSKPMAKVPPEVVIEVPSNSEIAVDDPKHGKMVYQAKLGLLGESKR